ERDGHHWPAHLLCHGEEWRVLRSGGENPSALAHAGGGDRGAGHLYDDHDLHAVSESAVLHRLYAELLRRDVGGFAVRAEAPGGMAETRRGEFRLSAGARV